MGELVDQVDEHDNIVGPVERSCVHDNNLWHRAAHIWVYSKEGRVLIQRRSKNVKNHPGLLDISAAGHVRSGISPEEGAQAEMLEEIGLDIKLDDLKCRKVIKDEREEPLYGRTHRQMLYMYFIEVSANTKFVFNDGEVAEVFWMPYETFAGILGHEELRDQFVPHTKPYLEYVVNELGTHIG